MAAADTYIRAALRPGDHLILPQHRRETSVIRRAQLQRDDAGCGRGVIGALYRNSLACRAGRQVALQPGQAGRNSHFQWRLRGGLHRRRGLAGGQDQGEHYEDNSRHN